MTDAKRDENNQPVMLLTLNTDGATTLPFYVDPTTHILQISDGTTGSDNSGNIAKRDNNGVPVVLGVSEADGITPTPIYANSSNQLLIDST